MEPVSSKKKRIVLCGAGHAHLEVVSQTPLFTRLGHTLTLIDPGLFWYSGLASGVLGGGYTVKEDQLDPQRLATACGAKFLQDSLVGLDPVQKQLSLASGRKVAYDVLSLNLGSECDTSLLSLISEKVWKVKPISQLYRLRKHLTRSYSHSNPCTVVVIGGGSTGCELAANSAALLTTQKIPYSLTLLTSGTRILPQAPVAASTRLRRYLAEQNIQVVENAKVKRVLKGEVQLANGDHYPADEVLLATGLTAPKLLQTLGMRLASTGELLVNDYLQSLSYPVIFGAGDCIQIEGHNLPKLGVFGVRQGPVLLHNLLAYVQEKPLQQYRPQKSWLSILNLGKGNALAIWGSFYWLSSSSFWLKDYIDRRFLQHYRGLYNG